MNQIHDLGGHVPVGMSLPLAACPFEDERNVEQGRCRGGFSFEARTIAAEHERGLATTGAPVRHLRPTPG
jgi:hypothetical protein